MKVIEALHREENGRTIVSLRFKSRDQILDPEDPSPLPHKELTQDAENAILNNVFAYWLKKPVNLEILIPRVPDPGSVKEISDAIRHHFRFVLAEHKRDTAIFLRERRTALALTGLNILIALLYIGYAYQHENWQTSLAGIFIGGFVVIINWATIWDTYEFFIFDGREKSQRKKLLTKIIDGEIQVLHLKQDE
ncbi:MAG: hypothetical protein MUO95_05820 [Methanoregula sp.]|jgi:hypothetical protein|nr:hypothetical protein [Methanoregula sp.]